MEQYFPEIPIVVSIGNHDFEPANFQEFKEANSEYLKNLSRIWERSFMGQEEALIKFREFGYFAVDAPQKMAGDVPLRIISINT